MYKKTMASQIKPSVWIGKNGINDGLLENIKNQLMKRKVVKIKLQKSIKDNFLIDEFLEKLKKKIGDVEILDQRGRTLTIGLNK